MYTKLFKSQDSQNVATVVGWENCHPGRMCKLHEFIQLAGGNNSIQSIQGGLHSLHKTYTKLDGQYPIPPGQRVENRLEQVVSQEMPR